MATEGNDNKNNIGWTLYLFLYTTGMYDLGCLMYRSKQGR